MQHPHLRPEAAGRATVAAFPPTLSGRRQGDRCSVPTYARGRRQGHPLQHPHLCPGPPAGPALQHPHLRPGAIDRPRAARYSSPFGDPLCSIPTGRWAGFVGQNPRPCGVPPGHLPTASLVGCVSQDLPPVGHPCSIPKGARDPWFCFACETVGRAIGGDAAPMPIHA